jgi:hypothetical protein
MEPIICLPLRTFWNETEHERIKGIKPMKSLSCLCELVSSSMIMKTQMGKISKLRWLIRVAKHAKWANSFHLLCLRLFSISPILASSESTL